jgi:hypothetical protein
MEKFKIFIVLSIMILYGLIIYSLIKDWSGPIGPSGSSLDLRNYKGDMNVSGSVVATGNVKSGDCQLSCTNPTESPSDDSSSMTIGYIGFGFIIVGIVCFYLYKKYA